MADVTITLGTTGLKEITGALDHQITLDYNGLCVKASSFIPSFQMNINQRIIKVESKTSKIYTS